MQFRFLANNVTAPLGFQAAAINCGIKKQKHDLGVILSRTACTVAGMFTTNKLKAAPVIFDMEQLSKSKNTAKVILVNSGIANAATGSNGLENVDKIISAGSKLLKVNKNHILMCSTGKIGVPLPVDLIVKGIGKVKRNLSRENTLISSAIMTTDTKEKEFAIEVTLGDRSFRIGGIAKGAGMINPSLATLLCFLTTDVKIPQKLLQAALRKVTDKSFNSICIDNDTSTNDSILILANGMSGVTISQSNLSIFVQALELICIQLAKAIVRDGEGATKLIEINVKNAATASDAHSIAKTIALSYLVKTAIFGNDPNWGRVLASVGYANVKGIYDYSKIDIYLGDSRVVENSCLLKKRVSLKKDELRVVVDMKIGKNDATVYTCDLSYGYVEINAEYTT